MFASVYIHHNDSLNTEVQKQDGKKLPTKVVNSANFEIHCNTFFQETSSFPKFSVKTTCEKIYWYKLQLHLLASPCYSYHNLLWQKSDLHRITSSKNSGQRKFTLTSPKITEPNYNSHYTNSSYLLLFLNNFNLKA